MTFPRFFSLLFVAWTVTTSAATVTVTGLDNNGASIGEYVIGGQTYWWLCIEPGPPALSNQTITANSLSFTDGWTVQNTERYTNTYAAAPTFYSGIVPKQVAVMEYVLDAYLPWSTLGGASGRFIEQSGDYHNFTNNNSFYNAMFAVQNFLSETEGKPPKSDFTNMSDYQDYYAGLGDPTDNARSAIFQSILSDVESKDASGFFATYTPQHDYSTINTYYPEADPNNWQDGLVLGLAPVPEPGSALLIASLGLGWMIRRRR
jgi:PEP-CTERM motif